MRVLAGEYIHHDGSRIEGHVKDIVTKPLMLYIRLLTAETLSLNLPRDHNVIVYVYKGSIEISEVSIQAGQLAQLSAGSSHSINHNEKDVKDYDKSTALLIKHHYASKNSDAGFLLIGANL